MEELLTKAKEESKESVRELVERTWFHECGFRDCSVARNTDTGELCFMAWLILICLPKESSYNVSKFRSGRKWIINGKENLHTRANH